MLALPRLLRPLPLPLPLPLRRTLATTSRVSAATLHNDATSNDAVNNDVLVDSAFQSMISNLPVSEQRPEQRPEQRLLRFQSSSSSSSQRNGRNDRNIRNDRNNHNSRNDRPRSGGGNTGYQSSRQEPESAKETVIQYKPPSAKATLTSLQPIIPATALTQDGLANVLFAQMAPVRRHMAQWRTLGKWRSYDRLRGMVAEEAVQGAYLRLVPRAAAGRTVAGEVKRMLMRNPTAGRRSKLLVVASVCKELGEELGRTKLPQLAAPPIRKAQPAIGAP